MAAPSAGRAGTAGSWEKGSVAAELSAACKAAVGVSTGRVGATGVMKIDPITAPVCAAQRGRRYGLINIHGLRGGCGYMLRRSQRGVK